LYVHNALDANISIFNTRDYALEDSLTIADITIPVDQLLGEQTFNSATDPRLSKGAWVSCANCHFDGLSDGRVWVGANTPSLFGLSESAPYTWSGAWSSSAAIELHIRAVQAGAGFVPGENLTANDLQLGIALDLDILANYVAQLPAPSALPAERGDVEHGKALFDAQGCADCHGGAAWSDGQNHEVGTGGEINTPSLRWLWASAPYLHDGRAARLQDVFTLPGTHHLAGEWQPADLDALAAYLLTLPN
jgi:cytochrome c peroxidase